MAQYNTVTYFEPADPVEKSAGGGESGVPSNRGVIMSPPIIDAPDEMLGTLTISAAASVSAAIPRVARRYDTLMLTCLTADFHYRLSSDSADPATVDDIKGYLGVPRLVPVDGRTRVHAIAVVDAVGSHVLEFVPVQTRGG